MGVCEGVEDALHRPQARNIQGKMPGMQNQVSE